MNDPKTPLRSDPPYEPPALILEAIQNLDDAANALLEGGTVQQVVSKTLSVQAAAVAATDSDVAAAAQDLVRYLETVGPTPRLSPRAVQLHIEALRQIVSLPPYERQRRLRLSDGVKRLVNKKLQDAMVR